MITKLQKRLNDIEGAINEIKAKAEAEGRDLTIEEFDVIEGHLNDGDKVVRQIALERRAGKLSASLDKSDGEYRTPMDDDKENRAQSDKKEGDWEFKDFLEAVVRADMPGERRVDPRLVRAASGASEGVVSDGGFLVQTDHLTGLLKSTYDTGMLARKCRRIPISGSANSLALAAVDETSRVAGSRWGGLRAYWAAEADTVTSSKAKIKEIELKLKKLMCVTYLTDELMQDSVALEAYVRQAVPDELAFKLDEAIFEGVGGGIPLGIMKSSALVSIAKETGQAATTLVAENIEKMYARLFSRSVANAEFFINQDVWPQIFQLNHAVGTGGVPMFIPAGGLTQAPSGTLLGRPITPIEYCETLGTKGDIVLADMSHYLLVDKGSAKSDVSMHVRFLYNEMTLRWTLRVDGRPIINSAMTPLKGSNTQSPFIALNARS